MKRILLSLAIAAVWTLVELASASAAWTVAVPFSPKAQAIRSQDIMSRPNRPLHVYGTMVRRGANRG
jgi:hypothetical protein